jgi:hypothetical protein
MKITHKSDYVSRRLREYPSVGDQLDAIWKYIDSLPNQDVPAETQEMLQKIKSIKTRLAKRQGQ